MFLYLCYSKKFSTLQIKSFLPPQHTEYAVYTAWKNEIIMTRQEVTPGLVKDTAPLFHIVHKIQFCTCAWFTKCFNHLNPVFCSAQRAHNSSLLGHDAM